MQVHVLLVRQRTYTHFYSNVLLCDCLQGFCFSIDIAVMVDTMFGQLKGDGNGSSQS